MSYGQTPIRGDKVRAGRRCAPALKCLRGQGAIPCLAAILLLSACAKEPPPILPPQEPSLCALYSSFRYSPAAAAAEALDALDKHNANERAFMEKCLLGDREKSLGPR